MITVNKLRKCNKYILFLKVCIFLNKWQNAKSKALKWLQYKRGYYEKFPQFRLLTLTSLISQFVHPLGWEGMG